MAYSNRIFKGTPWGVTFDMTAPDALDSRSVVRNLTELKDPDQWRISEDKAFFLYRGLLVYVQSEDALYAWTKGKTDTTDDTIKDISNWKKFAADGEQGTSASLFQYKGDFSGTTVSSIVTGSSTVQAGYAWRVTSEGLTIAAANAEGGEALTLHTGDLVILTTYTESNKLNAKFSVFSTASNDGAVVDANGTIGEIAVFTTDSGGKKIKKSGTNFDLLKKHVTTPALGGFVTNIATLATSSNTTSKWWDAPIINITKTLSTLVSGWSNDAKRYVWASANLNTGYPILAKRKLSCANTADIRNPIVQAQNSGKFYILSGVKLFEVPVFSWDNDYCAGMAVIDGKTYYIEVTDDGTDTYWLTFVPTQYASEDNVQYMNTIAQTIPVGITFSCETNTDTDYYHTEYVYDGTVWIYKKYLRGAQETLGAFTGMREE